MSEEKFWLLIWSFVLLGFVTFVGCITAGSIQSNIRYYQAQSECIAKGATWIPLRNDENLCLQLPSKD